MALSSSLPQINLGVQGETQRGLHSGAQRAMPKFRVGSNFRIIPEKYFSGVENVVEFLENIDNLTYYEIPTQIACAYLKGGSSHRTGTRLIHKILKLEMTEEKLIDHIINRLEPQILDYVEVRHPQRTSNLLQIIDKYEERFLNRKIRGIGRKIGGKRGVKIDTWTIADHGESSIDLRVKVLWIIGDSMVDAEVVNRIIDSTIKEIDKVVQGIVLSGVRMIETDI
ncbi:uncharacterized protein TNCV_1118891 [Trichonephila clavipes]|uniref:Uncharacterized protein n=1 Tax=Trichonephila clavipes TaxID=2585209 RepID=A0A8X6T0B0_TRICX|nr:uncharacterized protein TNCV_1118891 [Trichonephila clavipes]